MLGLAGRDADVMWRETLTEGISFGKGRVAGARRTRVGQRGDGPSHVLCVKLVAFHGSVERGPLARECLFQGACITAYKSLRP